MKAEAPAMSTPAAAGGAASNGWRVFDKLADNLKDLKGFMRFCGVLALGTLALMAVLGVSGATRGWSAGLVWVLIGLTVAFLVFVLASLGCVRLALSLEYATPIVLDTEQQKQDLQFFALKLFSLEVKTDDQVREYLSRRHAWERQFADTLKREFEESLANLRADLRIDLNGLDLPADSKAKVIGDLETGLGRLQQDFLVTLGNLFRFREAEAGGFVSRACDKNAEETQLCLVRLRDIVSRLPIRSGV
jgi:hypothetical protein